MEHEFGEMDPAAMMEEDFLAGAPSAQEAEHRRAVLQDIAARVAREGAHRARSHGNRARQFMPFAALKGYADMVAEAAYGEPEYPGLLD